MESFVHEASAPMCSLQVVQALRYLRRIGRGQTPHGDAKRPNHVHPGVWPPDALGGLAFEEERVVGGQQVFPRILIHYIGIFNRAQIG